MIGKLNYLTLQGESVQVTNHPSASKIKPFPFTVAPRLTIDRSRRGPKQSNSADCHSRATDFWSHRATTFSRYLYIFHIENPLARVPLESILFVIKK
jgi:hypothetical protein